MPHAVALPPLGKYSLTVARSSPAPPASSWLAPPVVIANAVGKLEGSAYTNPIGPVATCWLKNGMVVVAIAEPARPTWKYFPGEVGGPDGGGDGDGEGLDAGLGGVLPPPPPQPA